MSTDFDSPWKEALDLYFEQFLSLLFPEVHRQIDWSHPAKDRDTDFRKILRDSELGTRTVDKLMEVQTLDGAEQWVLIHIEVQTTPEQEFPKRMYVYNYRIFDRYNKSVASLAVLADEDAKWRPTEYRNNTFGCEVGIRFPTVKLLDVAKDEAALEQSDNPFAKIVLAHRKTQDTRKSPEDRYAWKIRLVRGLYEQGLTPERINGIFRFVDWVMDLPEPLKTSFWHEVVEIQKERQMPFISTPQWAGRCEGMHIGIEAMLEHRFGDAGLLLMPQIQKIYSEERLAEFLKALKSVSSLEDLCRAYALTPPGSAE